MHGAVRVNRNKLMRVAGEAAEAEFSGVAYPRASSKPTNASAASCPGASSTRPALARAVTTTRAPPRLPCWPTWPAATAATSLICTTSSSTSSCHGSGDSVPKPRCS